ncbi:hypothetical protein FDP41_001473 [Naegleria fowleri]|uniref:Uncharacterized protein n=1 Tax=Naegleria fowleri TaxID=5763 RepID=A0A6A5C1S9_NAEFO|nr:uncharacterized protein FDP41_001473 [Naegleria fowleri]KAF0979495.1 hypothetical protein FDP41_001473 [Naegleria fowleri]CAG4709826.1 unnamed protein product [Naegleria fowleri]
MRRNKQNQKTIPFIQESKSLNELQQEYKGNVWIRKNLELIIEDVQSQWELALCNWKDYLLEIHSRRRKEQVSSSSMDEKEPKKETIVEMSSNLE